MTRSTKTNKKDVKTAPAKKDRKGAAKGGVAKPVKKRNYRRRIIAGQKGDILIARAGALVAQQQARALADIIARVFIEEVSTKASRVAGALDRKTITAADIDYVLSKKMDMSVIGELYRRRIAPGEVLRKQELKKKRQEKEAAQRAAQRALDDAAEDDGDDDGEEGEEPADE